MGLISNMETVLGRELARLIFLIFILIVAFTAFVAFLLFLFLYFGLLDGFFSPIYALSFVVPIGILGGIFLVIPFWLFFWKILGKYNFGKGISVK